MQALFLLLLGAILCAAQPVHIGVFGLFRPKELSVRPVRGATLLIESASKKTLLEGAQIAIFRLAENPRITASRRDGGDADFILAVPRRIERQFHGTLRISRNESRLIAIVTMDREVAVASIIAAESPPGAGLEALKAQAVVTRSYLTASKKRHSGFDFCDTTHCEFLRSPPPPESLFAKATADTNGFVLSYRGITIPAMFSAVCGGTTRSLADARWAEENYPYFAVDCPYCKGRARLGHGLGLCQNGSKAMASGGSTFRQILSRYFPAAVITR